MKVTEIMTRNVQTADPDTPIAKVADKMRDRDIGFVPICEHDRLIGTVTDRDIAIRSVAQGRDPRLAPIREIMTQTVFYCYEDEDVESLAVYMQEKEVRRLLVLNRQKRLVGVVSIGDLAKAPVEKRLVGETLGQIAEAA